MEVAEDFFGPEIDAAFAGITMGEFDDRDALRPEEKKQSDDPEPDGDATVGGDRGDDIQIENGDDEKQDEVAAAEGADQVRLARIVSSWTKFCSASLCIRRTAGLQPCPRSARHCLTSTADEPCPPRMTLVRGYRRRRVPAALSPVRRRCR